MKILYKNIRIEYNIVGKGKTLVLLHGFLHSSNMWTNYLKKWTKNYQVLTIDLPGHGKSETIFNVSIKEMAEVLNLILEKENIQNISIVGHSLGGYVGLAFAEFFENKLEKLILLHSSSYADSELVKKKRNLWLKIIDKHPSMFVKNVIEFLYTKENLQKNSNSILKDIAEAKQIGYLGYIEAIKAMRDRPNRTKIFETNQVYIIAGIFDKIIEKETSLELIKKIKKGKGEFLKQSAHMGFIEEEINCFQLINLYLNYN